LIVFDIRYNITEMLFRNISPGGEEMERSMKGLATTRILLIVVIIIAAGLIGGYFLWPRPKTQLIVSTTTSLYETGFLDYLKQNFEQTNPGFKRFIYLSGKQGKQF